MDSRSRQSQQKDLPHEIMEHIFEQIGRNSKYLNPHVNPMFCTKTLRSCLFVSKYFRDLALYRLFQFMQIDIRNRSSLPRLDLLLEILCPSSLRVQWMSVLPFIRYFMLGFFCHYNKGFDLAEPRLLRLLSVLSGDQTHQLKRLALRFQACTNFECCHFTKAFQAAVGGLLKMPHLQSAQIKGAGFLPPDFYQGTHIRQLDISSYKPSSYSCSSDLLDEETSVDSQLRSLSTDTSFPFNVETSKAESLLEGLDNLTLYIRDDSNGGDSYSKFPEILRFSTSLTKLTLKYDELYSFSTPLVDWCTNFGEIRALETFEILVQVGCIRDMENAIVSAGMQALNLLLVALNSIRLPMPRLAHLRWLYSFGKVIPGSEELPFILFEEWLRGVPEWRTLDKTLTSDLFSVLSAVQIQFIIPRLTLHRADDEDAITRPPGQDITARMQHVRKDVFPRSVAALGEKFELALEV